MKRMITIFLILCIAAGALTAARIKPFLNMVSPASGMDRDRSWKIADKIMEDWDGSAWMNSEKNVYYYNSTYTARVDSVYTLEWESTSGSWMPAAKLVFTYFDNQEYIGMAEYSVMMGPYTIPFIHIYAQYDTQNRLIQYRMFMYDMGNANWIPVTRMFIVYGAGTTFQVFQWEAGGESDPAAYGKSDFVFDAQGRIIQETWQTSPDSLNWVNESQTTRTYHPNDTTTGAIFISNIAHQMVLNGMEENGVYFGMVAEEMQKSWSGTWENDDKAIYTYNTSNKLTELLEQDWYNNIWNNRDRNTYTYDTNGNMNQMVDQDNPTGTAWENYERFTYNWTQFTSDDDNVTPPAGVLVLDVYPNPFREVMTIAGKSNSYADIVYNIYNLKGQNVRSMTAAANASVTWDGRDNTGKVQATGLYFIRATQGNSEITRKFLKLN